MSGVPNGVSLENKSPLNSPTDIPHGALAERPHPASAASSEIGSPRIHVGFEGAEKKLEVNFIRTADLRKFSAADIESILTAAKCSIISVIRNEHVDAYLLAESSLFIYSNKFLLKTCGSTSPLDCIPKLLQVAKALGTQPDFVQYSRTQFAYPDRQPAIHRSFEKEVEYLNSFFPNGVGHIFGPINGPRWHLYTCDMNPVTVEKEQTLELVMTELDRTKLRQFFRHADPKNKKYFENVKLPTTADECTKLSGIDQLFPGSDIDAFLFEPCGYSCNGILGDSYFTIHITPEFHCSYISFETNVIVGNYAEIINKVLDTFKPGRFTISLFVDEKSLVKSSIRAMPDEYKGYVSKNIAFQQFDGPFNVTCAQVIALASQTATEEEKKLLVAATEELKAASETGTPPSPPLAEPINSIDFTAAAPAAAGPSKDPSSYSNTRKLPVPDLLKLVQEAVQKKYPVQSITMDEAAHPEKLIQTVVARDAPNEAFYLVDLGNLVNRFYRWAQAFPHLRPNYAVKCNGHPGVLLALNALGCGFVCSTVFEIKLLLTLGVAAKRITYANAWKPDSHIRYCAKMNVANLICSDVNELRKISKNFPSAQLILHISGNYRPKHLSPAVKYIVDHNTVSGAPLERVPELLQEAKKLQMRVLGISFDIGETCYEVHQFKRALKDAKECFGLAKKILGYELRSLDIGAGFPDLVDDTNLPQPIAPSSQPSAISTAPDSRPSSTAPSQGGSPNASPAPGASPHTADGDIADLSSSVTDVSKLSAASDAFASHDGHQHGDPSSAAAAAAANLPTFDSLVARLNHLIPKYFSSKVNFLARPARFLVTSSHLLAVCVIARRTVSSGTVSAPAVSNHPGAHNLPEIIPASTDADSLPPDGFLYYVNDGLYGSFNCMLYDSKKIEPLLVLQPKDPQRFHCTIFGPTCDGVDCIAEQDFLPRLEVGDWLYFRNMGAYSASSASSFNGFKPPSVRFISAPPAWLK